MNLPKTESARHERPGESPWPAALNLVAGVLLGIVPLLFTGGTQTWFSDAPSVWTYSLGFTVAMTSLGIAGGMLAVAKMPASGRRWLQTLLLLGAFVNMPLLPVREMIEVAPVNAAAELLKLLFLKAGVVTFAIGLFVGVRFAGPGPTGQGAGLPLLMGVLVGQLGFLMLLDPLLTTGGIDVAFSWSVLVFALVAIAVIWRSQPAQLKAGGDARTGREKNKRGGLLEAGLSGAVVALLIVVSARTMNGLVSVPRLWVLPVLITFVAFAAGRLRPSLQRPAVITLLQCLSAVALTASLYLGVRLSPLVSLQVLYLGLAAGVLACSAATARQPSSAAGHIRVLPFVTIVVVVALVTYAAQQLTTDTTEFHVTVFVTSLLVLLALARTGIRKPAVLIGAAGALVLATALGFNLYGRTLNVVGRVRTFYGVTSAQGVGSGSDAYLLMMSGDTPRAAEFLAEDAHFEPTLYHSRKTGIGLLFRSLPKGNFRHVGVIGVGNGDLLAYAVPNDSFQFYEFDPGSLLTADNLFGFLKYADTNFFHITPGDPRLVLTEAAPQQFDVLIIDAFGKGTLPAHLLTAEAFATWQKHLAPDGVLAVNITNHRFSLAPVVWRQAIELGLQLVPAFTSEDPAAGSTGADWVFLTNNSELLRNKAFLKPKETDIAQAARFPLWTDENYQPLSVLK